MLPYISTRNTARDMDVVRAALGEQKISYWGGSYGDEHVVPFVLFNGLDDDRDEAGSGLAAAVRVLKDAADGSPAQPTPDLEDTLNFMLTGAASATGSSQAAVFCGDRAVDRDPEVYWRKIERSRVHEPFMGPFLTDISPCAFWPVSPRERPTQVHNGVPALIVASTGDTRTVYQGGQALHRLMTGSRLLTLSGARIHAVYPRYDDDCVNDAVNAYLRTGILPATDPVCVKNGTPAVR